MVFNQSIYHSLKILAQSSVAASPSGGPSGPSPRPSQHHGSGAPGSSKGSSRSFLDRPGDINTPARNIWSPMSILSGKRKAGSTSKPLNPPTKKKAKVPSWTHVFVCLARMEQDIVPDSSERAVLQIAGLGEKKLQFPIDADSYYIYDELVASFPKLRNSGGFELLRTHDRSKVLIEIEVPPSGYTVSYLKPVVHNAKIFIRPLQKDLPLDPANDEVSEHALYLVISCDNCNNYNLFILLFSWNSLALLRKNVCFARK